MLLNWLMTKPKFSFYWYLSRSNHLWLSSRHLNAVSWAKTRALFFVCLFVVFLYLLFFCFIFYRLTLPNNQLENCIEQSSEVAERMSRSWINLIQKDIEKIFPASNCRPITCIHIIWKSCLEKIICIRILHQRNAKILSNGVNWKDKII